MNDRARIAADAAAGLRRFAPHIAETPVCLGFDGFVDSIIKVVDQRTSLDGYTPVATIADFGRKILAASGESSNYELVTTLRKLGGNGPIMANAMAAAGFGVTYLGALGHPVMDPVFDAFAHRADVHPFADPGFTDALEFDDGKLMLGKHDRLGEVNIDNLLHHVGAEAVKQIVERSALLGMVNWTMLTHMESIWSYLLDELLPTLSERVHAPTGPRRRMVFVDLADPEKRTREDLRHALHLVARFDRHADVVLGLNLKESQQVAHVLGVPIDREPIDRIESIASDIRRTLDIHACVVHPRTGAAAAVREEGDGGTHSTGLFLGPFVDKPKLSTGAGDNFNAGFCLGLLAGLPIEQTLCVGTATSGFYVRHAKSPTIQEVADFCDDLPAPEDG